MKKITKIMTMGLLLGMAVSDLCGMKRQLRNEDPAQAACLDQVEQPAEKRQEPASSEVILSDMSDDILESIFVQNTIEKMSLVNQNLINLIVEICRNRSICKRMRDFLSDEEVLRILQYAGLNLNSYDLHELLSKALRKGSASCMKVLIRAGAKVNETPRDVEYRCSLLHEAVRDEKIECIKVLVRADANIKAFDSEGLTVLEYAALTGNVEVLNTLIALSEELKLGLKVNDKDLFDGTALHWAVIGTLPNCPNFLRRLLELGANPVVYSCYSDEFLEQCSITDPENIKYKVYGDTPLHFAVMFGNKSCVQILVDHYLRNRIEIPEDLKPNLRKMGLRI